MKESNALLEIRKIRDKNAEATKNMPLKEKIDYIFKKGEQARRNLNLKIKTEYSNKHISQNDLSGEMIMEETTEYNDKEKKDK